MIKSVIPRGRKIILSPPFYQFNIDHVDRMDIWKYFIQSGNN